MIPYQSGSSAIITAKRKADPKKLTIQLDEQLTARILSFADGANYANFNEAVRALLNGALSADPIKSMLAMARQRETWQIRMRIFASLNQFFNEQGEIARAFSEEAENSLQLLNPGDAPPPTW